MLAPLRRTIARDHGAALVRGWVALYTLGLPGVLRSRRQQEVEADLAEETLDAIRRATVSDLATRRRIRLILGLPSDIAWRLLDAPAMAADLRIRRAWVPPTRWTMGLLAVAAIGSVGALVIVAAPLLAGSVVPGAWGTAGPAGFALACLGVAIAIPAAVPAPRTGMGIVVIAAGFGFLVAPALAGCWALAVLAVGLRLYQASNGVPRR